MVGAGLSLNALPAPGIDRPFPTWHQLARTMFDEIYPPSAMTMADREDQFGRSNPLRIASEYEAAFQRQKLESFLRSHVPDSSHRPGTIHERLLQLPWRDVFTTNYDTLLERTEVTERAYQPVTTVGDLTTATAPRIIKLHGTLPSQTPFIITEEDYRTYPRRFAPFVNTVRQSLIESSFVLIGFSGDDPNFLEWIGWIRDELDNRHAPIYLAGVLSLDHVQRSLLAKRGVTPIDLSPVFPDHPEPWEKAIAWFLESLMMGRPPSIYKWPKRYTITEEAREYSPPLIIDGLDEPEDVFSHDPTRGLEEETAWKILKRWAFERTRYPGWLVATDEIRAALWSRTERLIKPLIEFANVRSPSDRILVFSVINWRLEVSMIPLFEETKEPFQASIDDLFQDLSDGGTIDLPSTELRAILGDVDIEEAWLDIAFALLREAREMYDSQRWNRFNERIGSIVPRVPRYSDRYHYEQALWMMWNIQRSDARKELDKWSPSSHAALAKMQKAGLLVELDEPRDAHLLLRSALHHIRRSIRTTSGPNIYLLSLEGWCTYLLYTIESRTDFTKFNEQVSLYDRLSDRWQELKTWNCSPLPLLEYFRTVLTEDPPKKKAAESVLFDFDPGRRRVTRHWDGGGMRPWLPAFSCIRLYEQVGIPAHYGGSELANACKWIIPFTSFWSPALLIRAGKADELKKKSFLDRPQVATMKHELVRNIHQWALDALKREQALHIGDVLPMSPRGALLEVLIEVLSRLTVRLDPETLQDAFSVAIQIHAEPAIYSHITLHESCQSWLARLFTASSVAQLRGWLRSLIRFPLPDESKRSRNPWSWCDPITVFQREDLRSQVLLSDENREEVKDAINWLLERTRSESADGWQRAVRRLIDVYYIGIMTDKQKEEMARLVWQRIGADGFPDLREVCRLNYGHLPAPEDIDVVTKVKSYLLKGIPSRSVSVKEEGGITISHALPDLLITDMAHVSVPIVHIPYEPKGFVEWTRNETEALWSKVVEWWHNDKRALDGHSFFRSDSIVTTTKYAGLFLRHAVLPRMKTATDDEWEEILGFLEDTRSHDVYLTMAWPYVLIHRPDDGPRVERVIIDDLSSDVEDAVGASAAAIRHWVHLASAELLKDPSKKAFDTLLHRVVFRRPTGVATCLRQITLLLDEQPDFFSCRHVDMMISSLVPWTESVCLPTQGDRDGDFRKLERPELRELLGNLASALGAWLIRKCPDRPEPDAISDLRRLFESDPLPEVRRSFDVQSR